MRRAGAPDSSVVEADWGSIDRNYRRAASRDPEAVLKLLEDRLRDYDAQVIRSTKPEVAATVARMLTQRGRMRIVIPDGISAEWLPAGFEFVIERGLGADELDRFDGVMTASTVAIAETGSIVLQNVAGQGRRAATLVPDYHLCIVRAEDVVETVPEAMARLQSTSQLPTTFFAGPSATADIEMTRIKGVHGPRFLDVVLVG